MTNGYFRADVPRAYLFLRLNDIVNRLLAATENPVELKPDDRMYVLKALADAEITACTPAEMKVLRLLRREDCDRFSVLFKDGKPYRIEVEGEVPVDELKQTADAVGVKTGSEFETITVTRHKGKPPRVQRKTPSLVGDEDNERLLFGGPALTKNRKK